MAGNESLAHRYNEIAIKTANPLQLVVMLYDAAIRSLREAQNHIREKNIEARTKELNQCLSIISELQGCLNIKKGGEIANSLNRLYDYMKRRIFKANIDQSMQPLTEVEGLLENLRSAWGELVEKSLLEAKPAGNLKLAEHEMFGAGNAQPAQTKTLNISI